MKYKICNVIIDETDSERSSGIEMLKEFNYFKKCPRRIKLNWRFKKFLFKKWRRNFGKTIN